uniref:Uncharacterized protein n=1 Tax=Pavo cristatus TaxID=9049 RepID=A0A8C9LA46_PAVCR
ALSSYEPVPFSASLNESSPTGITDYNVQGGIFPEESRKKKSVTYEELRNKHRETYEVMSPLKAETPGKFPQERPVKEGTVLIYNNTWQIQTAIILKIVTNPKLNFCLPFKQLTVAVSPGM